MEKAIKDLTEEEINKICRKYKKHCTYDCPLCIGENDYAYICLEDIDFEKVRKIVKGAQVDI